MDIFLNVLSYVLFFLALGYTLIFIFMRFYDHEDNGGFRYDMLTLNFFLYVAAAVAKFISIT